MMLVRLVAVLVLGCLVSGCGIFKSSTSQASSESSSKSSTSSSTSSSGDDGESAAYQRDVQELVAAHAAGDADVGSFARDLGAVAAAHGVLDWERSEVTYAAVGRGLAEAGADRARVEAYGRALAAARGEPLARVVAGWAEPAAR